MKYCNDKFDTFFVPKKVHLSCIHHLHIILQEIFFEIKLLTQNNRNDVIKLNNASTVFDI